MGLDASPVVEVAFGSTWRDDPSGFTWTDISTYVRSGTVSRGRSSELEQFSAGTCSLSLDSTDRRFDPLNTAGPHYGDLLPRVPVRIRGDDGSTVHPIFYGYADGWSHRPGSQRSIVELRATDAFKLWATRRLPGVLPVELDDESPVAYWILESNEGLEVDRSGNGHDGQWAFPRPASDVEPLRRYGPSSLFSTKRQGLNMGVTSLVTALPLSVEFWIKVPDTDGNFLGNFNVCQQGGSDGFMVEVEFGASLSMTYDLGGTHVQVSTDGADGLPIIVPDGTDPPWFRIDDGKVHHCAWTSATHKWYVDGEPVYTQGWITPQAIPTNGLVNIGLDDGSAFVPDDGIELSDVAIYDTALTEAQIEAHFQAGRDPWRGDTTGARLARVLDIIDWPSALRDLDGGDTLTGPAATDRVEVLTYGQSLAEAEQGRLFVAADGKLTFHGNGRTITGTPAYTFSDDGTGTGILVDGLALALDDVYLFDAAEVTREGGVAQTVLADGVTQPSATWTRAGLPIVSDRAARALAGRIVFRYSTPLTRVDPFTVRPQNDPSSWATLLALELGDVVTVDVTPSGTGDPIELDAFVETIEHEFAPGRWTITLHGSPVDDTEYLLVGAGTSANGIGNGAIR